VTPLLYSVRVLVGESQRNRKSAFVILSSLMLPPYRGQSVKAAVASILESHPGKIYSIDDFIGLLEGAVEPKQKSRVRTAGNYLKMRQIVTKIYKFWLMLRALVVPD
jgi:hypothetical protein